MLEISSPNINSGAFTDITDPAVGGNFIAGGYTGTIDDTAGNPLAGRMAWSGNSGGYITTVANLGPNVNGQTIKVRFRMGTDEAVGAPGWRIDTIVIAMCPIPSPTPTATASPQPSATPTPTATPTPPGPCGEIADGGFEYGGLPSRIWNDPQTSTHFGTPLCDPTFCGDGGGTAPPRSGQFWVWFGGVAAPETAALGQDVRFPLGGPVTLHFWMRIGTVTTPFTDVLNVRVDGAIVQSYPEPAVAEANYSERVIDLSSYANGAVHNIEFDYIGTSNGVGSYVVDDVSLVSGGVCPTPTPSPTPTATPTPTPTPSPTPTPIPSPSPISCGNAFSFENFDGVTAPALPGGWVATNVSGIAPLWVTSTVSPDTAPNDAFINDESSVSDKVLDSRTITITSAMAQLSFRNNFNTEHDPPPNEVFWDGGVLEISSPNINGGAFTDVTDPAVGGGFVSGGYTGPIDSTAGNPLAGRMAWSGNSGGYITTIVSLGPNVNGHTITLRFRMGTDEAVGAPGGALILSQLTAPRRQPRPGHRRSQRLHLHLHLYLHLHPAALGRLVQTSRPPPFVPSATTSQPTGASTPWVGAPLTPPAATSLTPSSTTRPPTPGSPRPLPIRTIT